MRVFQVTYKDRHGQPKEVGKWYVEWRDHRDQLRRLPGFTSRAASEELGRRLESLTAFHRATGGQTDPALVQWLSELPERMRRRLGEIGLIAPERIGATQALSEHLDDFHAALVSKGCTAKHAALVTSRARKIIDGCGFNRAGDIRGSKVLAYLDKLRADVKDKDGKIVRRGIGAQTGNFYISALNQFCRWMVRDRRLQENPVVHMDRWNVRLDRRHDRRALTADEVRRLLKAAENGPERFGVPGPARAVFYRLAVETGLRAGELRSLARASLDLGVAPGVTVAAAYAKNRRQDSLPLRPETAALLKAFTRQLAPAAPLFKPPHPDTLIDMFRQDLAAAEIPYVQDGKFADVHALRHTCGSWLASAGVHPRVMQRILRHSTITLTMDRYAHVFQSDESAALAKLPDLSIPAAAPVRATGTDGATGD